MISELKLDVRSDDGQEQAEFTLDNGDLWISLGTSEFNSYTSILNSDEVIRLRDWLIDNL